MNQNIEQRIERLAELAGIKRFKRILQVMAQSPKASAKEHVYDYFRACPDIWENAKFTDRLHAKGFYKYSPEAVNQYFEQLAEALQALKK